MTRPVSVTVLGAGSWGTTVAALAAGNAPTTVWARDPGVAEEIDRDHTNTRYLPGHELPATLRATTDLAEAVRGADVLVVGVPSHGRGRCWSPSAARSVRGSRWCPWPRGWNRARACGPRR